MTIYDGNATVDEAIDKFYLDREGMPELIPIGFDALDDEVGGLGPGSAGILAAATGVGKSSAMLAAMLNSKIKVGAVSLEDGPDVVGTRILAALSGINSLNIRRKNLSAGQLKKVNAAAQSSKLENLLFAYPTAGSLDRVIQAVQELGEAGCQLIWLDYLQKVRGHRPSDRRNEVSETLTRAQEMAAEYGAALMAISQFRRLRTEGKDREKIPGIHHLKESGDLENEARMIILAHRQDSPDPGARVRFRLAKSTYGAEFVRWDMRRDESGTLREVDYYRSGEGL